jgi:hypothetical protein
MWWLVLAIALLGISGIASAQTMPVICGGLSEADCAILQQSQQAMLTLTSSDVALDLSLDIADIPDMPGTVSMGISGTGAFSGDLSTIPSSPDAVASMMSDPQAYSEFLQSALTAFDGELNLLISLPPDLTAGMINGDLPVNLRLVDGIGYIDFDALATALPADATAGMPTGWGGLDLTELTTMLASQMSAMGTMPTDASAAAMTDPTFMEQFITITRLPDATAADGAAVAVFETTIDYAGLMNSPEMQAMMEQSMQSAGADAATMDMSMMSGMFEGLELSSTTTIGTSDFYTRSTTVTFAWDMSSMMSAGEDVTALGGTPSFNMDMSIEMSNFNGGQSITAPEGANIATLGDLMGGMMGAPSTAQ